MALRFPPRARPIVWIVAATSLLIGQLAWLFLLRGTHLFQHDDILIGGQIILVAVVLIIAILLRTTPETAIRLPRRAGEWIIICGVIALQATAVVLLLPGLSDDLVRYRLDGRMWLAGQSPYATAPLDFAGGDAVDSLTSFPDLTTIYPATAEASFALAAGVERATGAAPSAIPPTPNAPAPGAASAWRTYLANSPSPYRAIVLRTQFALAMVLAVAVSLGLLREMKTSPWWAVLLGWNPLATLETGGMGHVDALGILMILLAILALTRMRRVQCGAWLALSAGVKPLAIFLLPFAMRHADEPFRNPSPAHTRSMRAAGIVLISFAVVAFLLLCPLLYQHGYIGWRHTARTYSHTWEANGSFYNLITSAFGQGDEGRAMARAKEMSRLLAAAALLAVGVAAWQVGASTAAAGYAIGMTLLLVSPVVYPWYVLWPLCFVPLLRGRAGWSAMVWSGTVSISYLLWRHSNWRLSPAATGWEYLPVYATVAMELIWVARSTAGRHFPASLAFRS